MKRIGLTAVLLGVALMTAGCTSDETATPDESVPADAATPADAAPAVDAAPADVAPVDVTQAEVEIDSLPAEPVAVEQPVAPPSESEAVEQPTDGSSAPTGGAKIADAIGKALWKGLLDQPDAEDPGEAPAFNQ